MTRHYKVTTKGAVSTPVIKTYSIVADSKEEAEAKAQQTFNSDYSILEDTIKIKTTERIFIYDIISAICMLIAIVISFITWKGGFLNMQKLILRPTATSIVVAIIFYCTLVVSAKGMNRENWSKWDFVFAVFLILLVSSYYVLFFGESTMSIPAKIFFKVFNIPVPALVIGLFLFFSVFSIPQARFGLTVIMMLSGIIKLNKLDQYMNLFGALYIFASFLGVLLYLINTPEGEYIYNKIKYKTDKGFQIIKNDYTPTKENLTAVKDSILAGNPLIKK